MRHSQDPTRRNGKRGRYRGSSNENRSDQQGTFRNVVDHRGHELVTLIRLHLRHFRRRGNVVSRDSSNGRGHRRNRRISKRTSRKRRNRHASGKSRGKCHEGGHKLGVLRGCVCRRSGRGCHFGGYPSGEVSKDVRRLINVNGRRRFHPFKRIPTRIIGRFIGLLSNT